MSFISSCQHPSGGFGGGPYQLPHLAPTYASHATTLLHCRGIDLAMAGPSTAVACRYAAVATLVNIGSTAASDVIDRTGVLTFLQQMCVPAAQGGGMTVHAEGEVDIRSCYLALAAAYMLGFDLEDLADRSSLVSYIQRCQTYEVCHPDVRASCFRSNHVPAGCH